MPIFVVIVVILLVMSGNHQKKKKAASQQQQKKQKLSLKQALRRLLGFAAVLIIFGLILGGGKDTSDGSTAPTNTPVTAKQTAGEAPTATPVPAETPVQKPGISGSNAYDLTIGAEDNGFAVSKRQATSDGYAWSIVGSSNYGSYTITIETNKRYEIHRAVFAHAGSDATFFPWAVTLPFDAADVEGAAAWVKACQKEVREASFTAGDAVWTYKPHDNGQHGGVLTLTVDSFEEYGLYLLDQLDE